VAVRLANEADAGPVALEEELLTERALRARLDAELRNARTEVRFWGLSGELRDRPRPATVTGTQADASTIFEYRG